MSSFLVNGATTEKEKEHAEETQIEESHFQSRKEIKTDTKAESKTEAQAEVKSPTQVKSLKEATEATGKKGT